MTRLLLAAALAVSAFAQDVTIRVNAASPATYKIPRTIYGTFLEPIGNSTYGGLWAQILENPSFEDGLWSASTLRTKYEANPALYRASELGLPTPWEPLDAKQGNRYEPRWRDAANSNRSLMLIALPDRETGIRQMVYLPVHRTRDYAVALWVKHLSGPSALNVSIRRRNRPDSSLASARLDAAVPDWTKYETVLSLKQGSVDPLEPVDLVISAAGGTRVLLDQVLLTPTDAIDGMDPEMLEMSKALRTPIIRFGGNYTSAYHWRDGIGPADKRVSMLNVAWGIPEYNQFGTDEFLQFCRLVGAEPQIALNLGTGTSDEAAEWVRYVNGKWNNGKGGLTWELGNELWGDFQTGYPTLSRISELTREFASKIRALDPQSRLIATGQDPDHFEPWNAEQLKNASLIDLLSTHFVVGPAEVRTKAPTTEFISQAGFALPVELERRLRAMHEQVQASPDARDRVGIAFTEWLFWGRDDRSPRYNNMGGAICTAGMLNTLMRTAGFVRISDMTGLIEFGGIWKKRGRVYGVPAYWAFRMYSKTDGSVPVAVENASPTYDVHDGNNRLPEIAAVPYLDIAAAKNEGGTRLTLYCVNRHLTRDLRTTISIDGFEAKGARVQTLTADSIYSFNDESDPDAIRPVETSVALARPKFERTFPRASVTVVELER